MRPVGIFSVGKVAGQDVRLEASPISQIPTAIRSGLRASGDLSG